MTACMGTLEYTAPEVWPSAAAEDAHEVLKLEYNKPVDIYALTLILHELFGGGKSFFSVPENCRPNERFILLANLKSRRVPPRLNLDRLPATLKDLVSRGVDSDPSKRPSVDEFDAVIKKVK